MTKVVIRHRSNRRQKHPTIPVQLFGALVEVDVEIHELIPVMNFRGLRTFGCCQGQENGEQYGYVMFGGRLAKPFMQALLRRWLSARAKPLTGLSFENHWNGFVVRWHPYDFKKMLRHVRRAVREVRKQYIVN